MKRLLIIALATIALCAFVAGSLFAEEVKKEEVKKEETKKPVMPAGQKVFTEAKCQMCHTIYAAGIGEPPAEDAKKDKSGPPDLSMTGVSRTAEWLSLFLQKKETLNDKQHMMSFKGSDEELTTLVDWLLTLKPAEKEAPVGKKAAVSEQEGDGEDQDDTDDDDGDDDDGHDHDGHEHGVEDDD